MSGDNSTHPPIYLDNNATTRPRPEVIEAMSHAFSEAYGDKGYTLVLDCDRTYLAQHHHFESISEAITRGVDIIPEIEEITCFDTPRLIGDTEQGAEIRQEIALLEELISAYRENRVLELEN